MPLCGESARVRNVVLLVDDSSDSRTMYATYLELDGFAVLEADNGVQAVATAKMESPDAVVMDVVLPTIDGLEATRLLRAEPATKNVVVVALSGFGEELDVRAAAVGVDLLVQKPCLPNVLASHLRALIAARKAR